MNDTSTVPAMIWSRVTSRGPVTILRKKDRGIWQAISWAQLGSRMRAIGTALVELGLRKGEVAGILGETGPDWIAIDLAIQAAGCVSLGLAPSDNSNATAETLAASGCRVLFVENEEQLDKVLHIRDRCPALARVVIMDMKGLREFTDPLCESLAAFSARGAAIDDGNPAAWDAAIVAVAPADIAVLAATSGTSEAPRLVALSHANLMTQIEGVAKLTGQTADDERLGFLPLSLIAERVFGLYVALFTGTVSNLVESAETVPENLREVRPTVMFAIPRIWEKLYATVSVGTTGATWVQRKLYGWAMGQARSDSALAGAADALVIRSVRAAIGLDRLRLAFVGAAPVSAELVRWYRTLGISLREVYGVTECGGIAAVSPADTVRPGAVGTPVTWGEVAIGEGGEVLLRGPHVCAGLWRNGKVEPATSADGWLHTGDIGRLEDGQLTLAGRVGEAIATADGREIMPAEFESLIKLSPFIADAVLVGTGRAALGCLVMLEHDAVEKWAQDRNIPFTSSASLVRAEAVVALIAGELAQRAPALAGFRIVAQRIEPEDPEVTPAMRLRRRFVLSKYEALIDDIYRAA